MSPTPASLQQERLSEMPEQSETREWTRDDSLEQQRQAFLAMLMSLAFGIQSIKDLLCVLYS